MAWSFLGSASSVVSRAGVLACFAYTPDYGIFGKSWHSPYYLAENMASQYNKIRHVLTEKLTGQSLAANQEGLWTSCLLVPVIDELLYCGLLQTIILKELPRVVLEKVRPSYVRYVDSLPARTLRVSITALLYGLAHNNLPLSLPQLTDGLMRGMAYESSNSDLRIPVVMHIFNNSLNNLIQRQLFGLY